MENLKNRANFMRKHNKRSIILAGIAWKIVATMIMVEKCRGPEDLSKRQGTEETWKMEQDGTYVKIDTCNIEENN